MYKVVLERGIGLVWGLNGCIASEYRINEIFNLSYRQIVDDYRA